MERAFKFYDFDETGMIDYAKLKRVSQEIGEIVPEDFYHDMIRVADQDHDGLVSLNDFVNIMAKMKIL
jgi:Ca2+-binding EF-hand superfamily protein